MNIIVLISALIIPLIIFFIVVYGIIHHTDVYDEFIAGAADGMKTVVGIAPTLVGLMAAVGILRASGFLDFLAGLLSSFTDRVGFPSQLVPLTIGTDSYIGMAASILMSCTETIFYTMSVYFMAAKVKKTRWTLPGALIATLAGITASIFLAHLYAG